MSWFRRTVDAVEVPYRRERAKWKVALRWTTGCITDPHTKWSSAARIVGVGSAITMWAYTTICALSAQTPNQWVIGSYVTMITAALALRAKSTQVGTVPPAVRRADIAAAALPADPDAAAPAQFASLGVLKAIVTERRADGVEPSP